MDPSILTVITPAADPSLTTTERVKAELNIQDQEADDVLEAMVAQASSAVSSYCKRVFIKERVSELIRVPPFVDSASLSSNPMTIMLQRRPVVSLISIDLDGAPLVQDTDFELDPSTGLLYRLCNDMRRRWSFRKMTIVYDAGFTIPTLPTEVERATITLIKSFWFARTRDPAMRSESQPGLGGPTYWVGSLGDAGQLPPDVQMMLRGQIDARF